MGKQDEIRKHLSQGVIPEQLIQMGYSKSTVYKIYQDVRSYLTSIPPPPWVISYTPGEPRGLPGNRITMNFDFENRSDRDLYLNKVGLEMEWLDPHTWYVQDVKDLVKPGRKQSFSVIIDIPRNITLGEYMLRFGVDGQYLPARDSLGHQPQTEWSEPIIFHVKHPQTGTKIFISHSTLDVHLVSELEKRLDNYGIIPIIAEDIPSPGAELNKKFQDLIKSSNIFLAILTEDSLRSNWVIKETNYALGLGKPFILLKDEAVTLTTTREWVSFSKHDSSDLIFQTVMSSINKVHSGGSLNEQGSQVLALGILAFLIGLALGGSLGSASDTASSSSAA